MIVDRIFTSHRLKDFIRISYYFENFEDVDIDELRHEIEKRRMNIDG
jgi:predicted phosphoribosyltransferase